MRETKFIQQNKEKWKEFEHILDAPQKDPDKLKEVFVQVTDDLSYSRTFYPNRSVRVYLNGLAQKVFTNIYRKRKSGPRRLYQFWTDELPLLVYESRRDFLISFGVFLLAFLIGILSSRMDPEFVQIILGSGYVEMTEENIASGDPMAVYKQRGQFGMSLGITLNNIWVAFLTFVMGGFYGIGSLGILIRNGIMVGAFQYFFVEQGLFRESFLTIWTHGTLEISAIIIAGAAGLTMGRGLAFPGTYSRLRSFQRSAQRGLKIMLGIVPIFVIAGFIEGYLTRRTETPDSLRLLFILICLGFVVFYFILYPRWRARARGDDVGNVSPPAPDIEQAIRLNRIKSSGQIFGDSFVIFRAQWRKILGASAAASLLYCGAVFGFSKRNPARLFSFPSEFMGTVSRINDFFINEKLDYLPFINILLFGLFFTFIYRMVLRNYGDSDHRSLFILDWLKSLPGTAVLFLILWTNNWYTLFSFIFLGIIPLVWIYTVIAERRPSFTGLNRSLVLLSGAYGRTLGLLLVFLLVGFLFFSILDTALFWLYLDMISWVVNFSGDQLEAWSTILQVFCSIFIIFLILGIISIGFSLLYYTLVEIREAPGLRDRIEQIGLDHRIRGIEKE